MDVGFGHTLGHFDGSLEGLRKSIITMASLTQRNLEMVGRGLFERGTDFCNEAISEDDEVDEFERQIDREGMNLIVRFAPVATDLREVLGSMKIATNLERISDHCVNIGKRTRKINKMPEVAATKTLEPLFRLASGAVRDSMAAFIDGDSKLALSLVERDGEVDDQHDVLTKRLLTLMEEDRDHLRSYLHLMFIVRFLERVGDHAVNIAEDVVFIRKGTDIRHGREASASLRA